jgi:hypothetical protein
LCLNYPFPSAVVSLGIAALSHSSPSTSSTSPPILGLFQSDVT